jgi:hypothetical protein
MRGTVHLTIATSLSMIITFILHCIMEHTPSRQSFLRFYLLDFFRDIALYCRSFYNNGRSMYRFSIMILSTFSYL